MFNKKVLDLLKKIPKGKITTYKEIANALNTKAYRAVGSALNKNPHHIIVPCHRVVNSNGNLGGFGLGAEKKIELLEQEGVKVKEGKIENFKKKLFKF
jgi:methylated-DNA-[protein]-cysteine S-methyltransferase